MKLVFLVLSSISLYAGSIFSQQLIINEISQGSGAKEYVELVVVGTSTCQTPVPCMDLRGVVLDDNDGYFSTSSSGSGVAAGAIRFANTTFWSCIPQGTIIVIYNENDVNPALPANDVSMSDGNCRLVLPANSNLLEGQSVSPTSSNPSVYPSSGWTAGGGQWSQISMNNSDDSFQIRNNFSTSTPSFSVSWGNNTVNSSIYFPTAGGSVFSLTNSTNLSPTLQNNWTTGSVGVDETPGVGNSAANSAWISSMNPQCGVGTIGLQITLSQTNETCPSACDGTITSTVTNGTGPYSYSWTNSATTANLTGLCPGTFAVQVTDQNGCTANASATILAGTGSGSVTVQQAGPFTTYSSPFQIVTPNSGGIWSSNCGGCLSSTGVFSPAISGPGTFQICYTTTGPCGSQDCIDVVVTNCPPQSTNENRTICPGTETTIFGQQIGTAGTYSENYTDVNGCDSTHTIELSLFTLNPIQNSILLCEGDSIEVYGNWIKEDDYLEEIVTDLNGCNVVNSTTIISENCFLEEFNLFIPNVFTPNNDGANDLFTIELEGAFLNEGFILNRWGGIIAEFDNENRTWNGKTKEGLTVVDGVYTYLIYYTPLNKSKVKAQGFVTVVR
jgi:gliding motility-associated-like protein